MKNISVFNLCYSAWENGYFDLKIVEHIKLIRLIRQILFKYVISIVQVIDKLK